MGNKFPNYILHLLLIRQLFARLHKTMKKNLPSALLLLALFGLLFSACLEDKCENTSTYTQWKPVYKTDAELKAPPQYQAVRPLKNTLQRQIIYWFNNGHVYLRRVKTQ